MIIALLGNWWVEIRAASQTSLLLWRLSVACDAVEFEGILQNSLKSRDTHRVVGRRFRIEDKFNTVYLLKY